MGEGGRGKVRMRDGMQEEVVAGRITGVRRHMFIFPLSMLPAAKNGLWYSGGHVNG